MLDHLLPADRPVLKADLVDADGDDGSRKLLLRSDGVRHSRPRVPRTAPSKESSHANLAHMVGYRTESRGSEGIRRFAEMWLRRGDFGKNRSKMVKAAPIIA